MAPHHELHGHPLLAYEDRSGRSHSEETAETLEMDQNSRGGPGLRFDWSMNLGHLVAIVTIGAGVFASYYGIKAELQHDTDERAALTRRVEDIERGRMINLPKLDEQGQHNKVQDEQIQSLREALQSLRVTVQEQARNITDLTKLIYDANAKVLVLENQVLRSQASTPHDR